MVVHGYIQDNEMEPPEPQSRCSPATSPRVPGRVSSRGITNEILQKTTATPTVPAKHGFNGDDAGAVAVNFGKRFMSQIFDIYVGPERHRFTAHEAFLTRSKRLKVLCTTQTVRKGNGKAATTLIFAHDNPENFGHMLEYLYFNTISLYASEPLVEAKQLADLFSLANRFLLDEMQEDIIARLEQSEMSSKISPMQFFNLAEDLFTEDKDCGLHAYFAKAAPPLIRAAEKDDLPELERMVSEGGEYAQALFAAYREAFGPRVIEESVEASDVDKVIDVETETNHEPGSDIKDQHEPKKVKLSPSSKPASPPCSLENLSQPDKTLVHLRAESNNWNQIRREWEEATGEKASIRTLVSRYRQIFWWNINNGYMPLLLSAEAFVQSKFETEKWDLVARIMVLRGAEIRFPGAALRMAFMRVPSEEEERAGGEGGEDGG